MPSTDYVQGMPRRFTDPDTSMLSVITYETLSTMGPDAIQQMFSQKNVVVTGYPCDINLKFDALGLRTLTGSMSTQISITGTYRSAASSLVLTGLILDFSTMAASDDDRESCVPSVLKRGCSRFTR